VRLRALLLALLLVPLAGCLEDEVTIARLDQTRSDLTLAQAELRDLAGENRAWRDQASAAVNESAFHRIQRDDAWSLYNVTDEKLARAKAELDETRAARDASAANESRLAELLAEAEKVTSDNRTLQDLATDLQAARAELARLQRLYDQAAAREFHSLTRISHANVTWQFTDLRGDTRQWRYPMEEYREDVKRSRPMDSLYITTEGGRHLRVPDPRPYSDPEPFAGVIADLTNGRSEQDFVREVFHLKRQLVVYQFALVDEKGYYKYPGETLVEGTGVCGDTTILLQSLLAAGKAQAGYGFETALWVVNWDLALGRLVERPETVNHALLEVKFSDGTVWYIETTSFDFVTHPQAHGWRYAWGG